MKRSLAANEQPPERAYLDANVLRGQLTTNVLLTLAERRVFDPHWSQEVLDEVRRNRPEGVSEQKIDRRIAAMTRAFPKALTLGYEDLTPEMRADEKDRHVLAAAVHSRCAVVVTENDSDFSPAASGPHAMQIERLSDFLNRKLDEQPRAVVSAMQEMARRHMYGPKTMPELLDRMADQTELRRFAQKLNGSVPADQRGSDARLQSSARDAPESAARTAQDGIAPPEAGSAAEEASQQPATGTPSRGRDHGRGPHR